MKIKYKLLFSYLGLFLIIFVVVGFVIGMAANNVIKRQTINHLQTTAESRTKHLETYFQQNIERLKLVTSRTSLRKNIKAYNQSPSEDLRNTIVDILNDAAAPIESFDRICIIDPDGQVIASTSDRYIGTSCEGKAFFENGSVGEVINFIEEDGKTKIFVSGPIILGGELLGVGITVVSTDVLMEIVQERTGLRETGEVLVAYMNIDGERIYPITRLFEDQAVKQDYEKKDTALPMKKALEGRTETFLNSLDYRDVEVFAVSNYVKTANLGLVAKIDKYEALQESYLIARYFASISLVVSVFTAVAVYFLGVQIVKPIDKLVKKVEEVEGGDLDANVVIDSKDEIGDFSRTFERMVQAVKKSRQDIDKKVKEQTGIIVERQEFAEKQRKALLNVLEDIDEERKRTEQEKDKISAILYSIGDGVFVVDKNLKIVLMNDVALKLCGIKEVDALGKHYKDIIRFELEDKKGKVKDDFILDAIKTGKVQEMANHTVLVRRDGSAIPVSDSSAPLIDKDGDVVGCVVVFRDVTKDREVDRMKTDFLSVASHQLRTPLGSMRWNLEMLKKGDFGRLKDEVGEVVDQVYEGNIRMIKLVDDLLNVSRIDQARVKDDPKDVNFELLIKEVIKEQEPFINKKEIELILDIQSGLPTIKIDPTRLRDVVQNLISNAIKYNMQKGKIMFKVTKVGRNFTITVKDTGTGIPTKDIPNLFNKFFRAENARQSDTEGSGLGLFVVKQYVESWGGSVAVESKLNRGTTFAVRLPETPKSHILDVNLKSKTHQSN